MMAFVFYTPSLEAMAQRWGERLGTLHQSTLSYALRRVSSLALVQRLLQRLEVRFAPKPGELVVLDSMPMTLPATRQHGFRAINKDTVGGGVLWAWRPRARTGTCPIKILRLISGPWHDTQAIADVELTPRGPVYLMDRGFWSINLIRRWLGQRVRFIVRINKQDFKYTALETCAEPRKVRGGIRIEFDGIARLGGPQRKAKPTVRLVVAWLADGKDLVLASDRMDWNAERLLESYRQRWQIEEFHRLLKTTLGLAHLYSFQERGMFFLLHVAVLLAVLLFISGRVDGRGDTLAKTESALGALRQRSGLFKRWRRNMLATHQNRNRKTKKQVAGST